MCIILKTKITCCSLPLFSFKLHLVVVCYLQDTGPLSILPVPYCLYLSLTRNAPNAHSPKEKHVERSCGRRKDAKSTCKGQATVIWRGRRRRRLFQDNLMSLGKAFVFLLRPAEATERFWAVTWCDWAFLKIPGPLAAYGERIERSEHGFERPGTTSQFTENEGTHYWYFCDLQTEQRRKPSPSFHVCTTDRLQHAWPSAQDQPRTSRGR